MCSKILRWIVIAVTLVLSSNSFAWGPDGHRVIALIAGKRLTDSAAAQVNDLLGSATLADVANWGDEVREQRPDTGSWHFVNIPVDADKFDEDRDGRNGNNVIDAIEDAAANLADKHKSADDRAEALKWLVHFIGDVHEPLHCAVRDHDAGGNTRLVFFLDQQRAVNLHKVWDSSIIRRQMGNNRFAVFANALNIRISAAQANEWARGTPEDWANQSHEVAVRVAYAGVPASGPPPKLDQDYVDRAENTVDIQLERGGVRLAEVLNRILK